MSNLEEEKMEEILENQNDIKKVHRAKKMMLWFGIVSLGMSFAGLTSAYVISKERPDWLTDFVIPQSFYFSLIVIILSSITIHFAKTSIVAKESKRGMILLIITFLLGISFTYLQFRGFSEIISNGYYFTGSESSITTSFIYLVVILHLTHIIFALISVLVVIYNHYKQKYANGNTLGVELATTFWHFVDFLWIYLFLFFYFVR
ncbi:MAG: heme/copper-type cytochrome/quinol oxidase subunit 3 [Flavobacteriaceae bacterium]|jgi:heme/copper-type cytochrome/quinol oxidase subunit 3|uniref:cytochrome c oxidase subunit 3 n=1 Tax=Candidatus Marifrigoribacter sp. Uisw_064 TaxID=3230970 RepID=UPI003AE50A05